MEDSLLRLVRRGSRLLSVLVALLGLTVVLCPEFSLPVLCRIGGTLAIAFGCIRIAGYLARDLYRLAFQHDLAFGILLGIVGMIGILRADTRAHLPGVLLGVSVLADSLLKVQTALDAKDFGIPAWWRIFILAAGTGIVSLLLLLDPTVQGGSIRVLAGLALMGAGLLNDVTVHCAMGILRPPESDSLSEIFPAEQERNG